MNCVLYSIENGKVEVNSIKGVRVKSSRINEIFVYPNHRPIIGDINGEFEILQFDSANNQTFYVNTGFFEFSDDLMTIVANFSESK